MGKTAAVRMGIDQTGENSTVFTAQYAGLGMSLHQLCGTAGGNNGVAFDIDSGII